MLNKQASGEKSGVEIWDPPQGALILLQPCPKVFLTLESHPCAYAPLSALISIPMPEFKNRC